MPHAVSSRPEIRRRSRIWRPIDNILTLRSSNHCVVVSRGCPQARAPPKKHILPCPPAAQSTGGHWGTSTHTQGATGGGMCGRRARRGDITRLAVSPVGTSALPYFLNTQCSFSRLAFGLNRSGAMRRSGWKKNEVKRPRTAISINREVRQVLSTAI